MAEGSVPVAMTGPSVRLPLPMTNARRGDGAWLASIGKAFRFEPASGVRALADGASDD
jgi:hypothetical protein